MLEHRVHGQLNVLYTQFAEDLKCLHRIKIHSNTIFTYLNLYLFKIPVARKDSLASAASIPAQTVRTAIIPNVATSFMEGITAKIGTSIASIVLDRVTRYQYRYRYRYTKSIWISKTKIRIDLHTKIEIKYKSINQNHKTFNKQNEHSISDNKST